METHFKVALWLFPVTTIHFALPVQNAATESVHHFVVQTGTVTPTKCVWKEFVKDLAKQTRTVHLSKSVKIVFARNNLNVNKILTALLKKFVGTTGMVNRNANTSVRIWFCVDETLNARLANTSQSVNVNQDFTEIQLMTVSAASLLNVKATWTVLPTKCALNTNAKSLVESTTHVGKIPCVFRIIIKVNASVNLASQEIQLRSVFPSISVPRNLVVQELFVITPEDRSNACVLSAQLETHMLKDVYPFQSVKQTVTVPNQRHAQESMETTSVARFVREYSAELMPNVLSRIIKPFANVAKDTKETRKILFKDVSQHPHHAKAMPNVVKIPTVMDMCANFLANGMVTVGLVKYAKGTNVSALAMFWELVDLTLNVLRFSIVSSALVHQDSLEMPKWNV